MPTGSIAILVPLRSISVKRKLMLDKSFPWNLPKTKVTGSCQGVQGGVPYPQTVGAFCKETGSVDGRKTILCRFRQERVGSRC